jgi:NAD(P)-dependent dehydrogenase (short-subunit alcohol dehydrogenase family)
MARNGRGVIISISSIVGIRGIRRMVAYTTSKAAIDGMTRALALDLAPYGVRVNAVAPGIVWSPERWGSAVPADRETRERAIPLQRIGLPEDVAAACAFLASDDGSYITGQVLYVDGGLSVQARTMHDDPNGFDPSRIAP